MDSELGQAADKAGQLSDLTHDDNDEASFFSSAFSVKRRFMPSILPSFLRSRGGGGATLRAIGVPWDQG